MASSDALSETQPTPPIEGSDGSTDRQPHRTVRRVRTTTRRLIDNPRAPVSVLLLILLASFGARLFHFELPCNSPCKTDASHTLIFDESYYVNAARVIDGIHPAPGSPYDTAPLHKDPNAEHPQLAKLVIAGGIKLFGDNPWGWRLGSVLFGMIALVALYALVLSLGGSPWLATGTTAVMAADNLALIHGRIATLDIYVLATVLVAAVLYVREHALLAGIVMGIAGCMKLVGLGVIPAFILYEAFRVLWARGRDPGLRRMVAERSLRLVILIGTALLTLVAGIWVLDLLLPAYDPGTHITYAGDPFKHISHMLDYAAKLKAVTHATGISSPPWQWLLDKREISYARVAVNSFAGGKMVASRAVFDARGEINQFIVFLSIPALFAAVAGAWRDRDRVAALGAAWCVGVYLPFLVQYVFYDRISYLYYMLLVMPGLYLVTARMFSPSRVGRAVTIGWAIALVISLVDLYPVRSITGT